MTALLKTRICEVLTAVGVLGGCHGDPCAQLSVADSTDLPADSSAASIEKYRRDSDQLDDERPKAAINALAVRMRNHLPGLVRRGLERAVRP